VLPPTSDSSRSSPAHLPAPLVPGAGGGGKGESAPSSSDAGLQRGVCYLPGNPFLAAAPPSGAVEGTWVDPMIAAQRAVWEHRVDKHTHDAVYRTLEGAAANKVPGGAMKDVFAPYDLGRNVLAHIFTLMDMDGDGFVDDEEFAVGMHLIGLVLTKKQELPLQLSMHWVPPLRQEAVNLRHQHAENERRAFHQRVQRAKAEEERRTRAQAAESERRRRWEENEQRPSMQRMGGGMAPVSQAVFPSGAGLFAPRR
jgi:hypothetical protein